MRYVPPLGRESEGDAAQYINGQPDIGRLGSIPPADAFEHPMREIVNVINYSGITPSATPVPAALRQMAVGIRSQYMNYAEDHGTPNNLIADFDPHITEYTLGLTLRVKVRFNNDAGCTINAGAGTAMIRRPDGIQLIQGDLKAGMIANIVFDGTAFQLLNYVSPPGLQQDIIIQEMPIPYCVDTSNTPNVIIAPFSPVITDTDLRPGLAVLVKVARTVVTPPGDTNANTVIHVNNIAPIPVYANGHGPLHSYDINADDVKLFVYDGTVFWVEANFPIRAFGVIEVWVRWQDGDDVLGDGSANQPGVAFKTIQVAYDRSTARYAPSPLLTINIRLGQETPIPATPTGRYEGAIIGPYGGQVAITGATTNPADRTKFEIGLDPRSIGIQGPNHCIQAQGVRLNLNGVNLVGTVSSENWSNLYARDNSTVNLKDCQFELRAHMGGSTAMVWSGFNSSVFMQWGTAVFQGNNYFVGEAIIATMGGNFFGGGNPFAPMISQFLNINFHAAGFVASANSMINNSFLQVHQAGCQGRQFIVGPLSIIYGWNGWAAPGNQSGFGANYGLWIWAG